MIVERIRNIEFGVERLEKQIDNKGELCVTMEQITPVVDKKRGIHVVYP